MMMIGKPFEELITIDTPSRYNRLSRARRDGRWWMLKGLNPEHENDAVMRELLHKEFNLGMMLRHQGIVGVVSLERVPQLNGGEFIVQEWVEGVTLKQWLADSHKWQDKVNVLQQMCDVLDYCHRMNVVHRDIKPSNIMITPDGRVVIIDMGLAVAGNQSIFRGPAGTERYMAPEQRQEGIQIDGRADLYAVGRIMQEMALPRRFGVVIKRLTEPDRERRIPDAMTLRRELSRVADIPRRRLIWGLGALAVVAVAVAALILGRGSMGYQILGHGEKFAPTLPDYLTADTVNHWADDTAHYMTVTEGDISYSFPKAGQDFPGNIPENVAVDLGLNVLWAPFNVGCDRPSLCMTGGFYGYGDPTGKLIIASRGLSTYWNINSLDDYSGTEYDIATVQWGGKWRTPRKADLDELINRCQWTYLEPEGVPPGYLVIGPNGNRIYLPLVGFRYENDYYELGKMGYYWVTTPRQDDVTIMMGHLGLALVLVPGGISVGYADVGDGFSIRPVLDRQRAGGGR